MIDVTLFKNWIDILLHNKEFNFKYYFSILWVLLCLFILFAEIHRNYFVKYILLIFEILFLISLIICMAHFAY